MSSSNKQWTILGAGAVGHLLACRFAQQGISADLIYGAECPNSSSVVEYHFNDSIQLFSLDYHPTENLNTVNYLILAVKSHQVSDAILSIRDTLTTTSQIFLLQNGMGTLEEVIELTDGIMPQSQIYPGTNNHGVYLHQDDDKLSVIHGGDGDIVFGANYLHSDSILSPESIRDLNQLGLNTTWSPTIEKKLWLKLAVNAAINPLTAINNCVNGELLSSNYLLDQVRILCDETAELYAALQLNIDKNEILSEVMAVIKNTAANKSSMLQDVSSSKNTEIESITGYLLRKSDNYQLKLDTHQHIYDAVLSITKNLN